MEENVLSTNCEATATVEEKSTKCEDTKTASGDPYAYTRRDEFTSENFKVEIRGLPRYFPVSQVKKLLKDKFDLGAHKVKPHGPNKSWAYVNFRDEESRNEALKVLDGYKWKNCTLSVKSAKPAKDPLLSLRDELLNNKDDDDGLTVQQKICKAVTPFVEFPYEDQLKKKEQHTHSVLKKFGNQLADVNWDLREFVSWNQKHRNGQVCEVMNILPSPVTDNYRNKCEFTVGINPETQQPTVGFRLASYKGGSVNVGSISHLKNIPDAMKAVVKEFEDYVVASGLAPFDPVTHKGTWRQITCRTTTNHDLLIIIVIHPQDFTVERLKEEKDKIVSHFTSLEVSHRVKVTSIYFHAYAQRERGTADSYEHLWGKEHITETIKGKHFRVSPHAFLQVNTPGCEVLYNTIGDMAGLDNDTVLLDICCGTGTIGLSLASECKHIVGVDIVSEAIKDAQYNADNNNIKNATYYDGKAEDHIAHMLETHTQHTCVAVVDPPRAGLHNSVVCALRKAENLNRFVFASCDPRAAIQNFLSFGRPSSKTYRGSPFIPIKAIPVDMFPHTPHYELVVVFERFDQEKWKRIVQGNPRPCDKPMYDELTSHKRKESDSKDDSDAKRLCLSAEELEETS